MSKIIVCGSRTGCCPTIDIKEKEVVITDDYKGKVTFTPEQWKELKQKIVLGEC